MTRVNHLEPIMRRTTVGLISLTVLAALATAASAADVRQGEVLAKRWCASCHVVASDQQSGNTQAPPFSAIGKQKGLDGAKVALFLLLPHPKMPDMNLSRNEAADLAAYIESQAK
jgi:mono/diheme cytochrome c family protein